MSRVVRKANATGVLIIRGDPGTDREHSLTEAEPGVMQLQAKGCWQAPEARKRWEKYSFPELSEREWSC